MSEQEPTLSPEEEERSIANGFLKACRERETFPEEYLFALEGIAKAMEKLDPVVQENIFITATVTFGTELGIDTDELEDLWRSTGMEIQADQGNINTEE